MILNGNNRVKKSYPELTLQFKLSYCSRNSVCRSILSHESHHTRTSLGYQDYPNSMAAPPPQPPIAPKLHNHLVKEQKSLYRTHSARVQPNNQPIFQQPRRESLGGFGTNGSGRSSRLSSNRTKQPVSRCLNPDDIGEMKRNEQIKGTDGG